MLGAIAKCRKLVQNYGKGGKSQEKAEGGLMKKKWWFCAKKTQTKTKNPNIARGCGVVMNNRRKVTKFR